MISLYLKDTIRIVSIQKDEWGIEIKSESAEISARVEDVNKLIINDKGQEVQGNTLIIIDAQNTLKNEDRIKIIKRNGEAYKLKDKEFMIKRFGLKSGFKKSHYEVYL